MFGLRAFDSQTPPITIIQFNTPVTIVLPFTFDQLTQLGITPEQLMPQYWDTGTSIWKPIPYYFHTIRGDGGGSLNLKVSFYRLGQSDRRDVIR